MQEVLLTATNSDLRALDCSSDVETMLTVLLSGLHCCVTLVTLSPPMGEPCINVDCFFYGEQCVRHPLLLMDLQNAISQNSPP